MNLKTTSQFHFRVCVDVLLLVFYNIANFHNLFGLSYLFIGKREKGSEKVKIEWDFTMFDYWEVWRKIWKRENRKKK